MVKILNQIKKLRMLIAGLAIGLLVAIPIGVYAVNNETDPPQKDETQQNEQKPINEPQQPEEKPVPETPVPEPVVQEVIEENEENIDEVTTENDLQTAITIASLEHPDVEVVSAKLKYLNNEKVFKISFVDGWRIYVRASDGDVVIIKDWLNIDQPYHHRAKKMWLKNHNSWNPWKNDYRNWCKAWVKQRNWNGYYGGRNGWYNHDWQKPDESTTELPNGETPNDNDEQVTTQSRTQTNKPETRKNDKKKVNSHRSTWLKR